MSHPALLGLALCVASVALAESKVARPSGATAGVAVAHVVVASGAVKLADGRGAPFDVAPGLPLLKTDTLQVPPAAFVLVQVLANKLVVRIDEDVDLAVKDIAVLDAKADAPALEVQLEKLLTRAERGQLKERMAGWYSASVAATVPTVQSEKSLEEDERPARRDESTRQASGAPGSLADHRRGESGGAAAKSVARESSPAPAAMPPPPPPAPAAPPPVAAEAPPKMASNRPMAEVAPKEEAKKDVAGKKRALLLPKVDAALKACLLSDVHNQALRGVDRLTLRFLFEDGVPHVVASRGAFVPDCAVAWVTKHAQPFDGGWQTLVVPLK